MRAGQVLYHEVHPSPSRGGELLQAVLSAIEKGREARRREGKGRGRWGKGDR